MHFVGRLTGSTEATFSETENPSSYRSGGIGVPQYLSRSNEKSVGSSNIAITMAKDKKGKKSDLPKTSSEKKKKVTVMVTEGAKGASKKVASDTVVKIVFAVNR